MTQIKTLQQKALITELKKILCCNEKVVDEFLEVKNIKTVSDFISTYGYIQPENFGKIQNDFVSHFNEILERIEK